MQKKKIIVTSLVVAMAAAGLTKAVPAIASAVNKSDRTTRVITETKNCNGNWNGWVAPGESCTVRFGRSYSNQIQYTVRAQAQKEYSIGQRQFLTPDNSKLSVTVKENYLMLTAFEDVVTVTNNSDN